MIEQNQKIKNKIIEILKKTGYLTEEKKWRKKPRKNYIGRMLGLDLKFGE